MKWIIIGLVVIVILVVILIAMGRLNMLQGHLNSSVPEGYSLGVTEGKLAPCKNSNNCVSSQSNPQDRIHYIEPIKYSPNDQNPLAELAAVVSSMPGGVIKEQTETYIRAEFTTKLMRFIDDVEFVIDPEQHYIDVRSAARLGKEDMGVNRKRVENIRTNYRKMN